jgi:hypothetical protein
MCRHAYAPTLCRFQFQEGDYVGMKWRAGHIEGTVKDVKDDGHVVFTTTKGKDVCGNGNQTVSSFVL